MTGWSIITDGTDRVDLLDSDLKNCTNYKILGGPNIEMGQGKTLQKVFKYLPSHSSMEINFDFIQIGSWKNEVLYVSLDDITVHTSNYISKVGGLNLCGSSSWSDSENKIVINKVHDSSNANITIWTNLNQPSNYASFGIRNFVVYLSISCSIGCLTCSSPNYCTSCPSHSKLINGICSCKSHYYMEINNWVHCHPCYITCKNCNSKESSDCTECYEGYQLSSGSCVPNTSKNKKFKRKKAIIFVI